MSERVDWLGDLPEPTGPTLGGFVRDEPPALPQKGDLIRLQVTKDGPMVPAIVTQSEWTGRTWHFAVITDDAVRPAGDE